MARSFRPVVRDQPFLIAPDMREWLPADHLVWFVLDAVNALDVSAFRARRRLGGAGRAPYDPVMLLALLIYGYAVGQRSSRQLERLCGVDVAFRIICGNDAPDHVTIARFRAEQQDGLESLFEQILVLCARAGMGRLGVVALDGTKIAANAAPGANRSEKWLRGVARQWLDEAAAADAAEDEAFGAARGDELPAELAEPRGRPARIRQILDELDRERAADTSSRGAQRVDHGAERVRQAQDRLQRARADRQRQGRRSGCP